MVSSTATNAIRNAILQVSLGFDHVIGNQSNVFPQSDCIALTISGPLTRLPVAKPSIAGHVLRIVTGRT
jgi:hypothetical protein